MQKPLGMGFKGMGCDIRKEDERRDPPGRRRNRRVVNGRSRKREERGRGQFTLALDDAGGLTFMRETGLTSALRSKRHLKPNTYTHVAASYGFGDASIFINGTLDATRKEGAILREATTDAAHDWNVVG